MHTSMRVCLPTLLAGWYWDGWLLAWISLAMEPVEPVESVEVVDSERWLGVRPRVAFFFSMTSSSPSDRVPTSSLPPSLLVVESLSSSGGGRGRVVSCRPQVISFRLTLFFLNIFSHTVCYNGLELT